MQIKVIKKRVKNYRITVKGDGQVIFTAPITATERDINRFLEEKRGWIEKQLAIVNQNKQLKSQITGILYEGVQYSFCHKPATKGKFFIQDGTIYTSLRLDDLAVRQAWYKKLAQAKFSEYVAEYSAVMGVKINKIYIRNGKTRWGSCSTKGNVSFNLNLVKAPVEVAKYVVVHELCHLGNMTHNKAFWVAVGKYCPNYLNCRKWLKQKGNLLLDS